MDICSKLVTTKGWAMREAGRERGYVSCVMRHGPGGELAGNGPHERVRYLKRKIAGHDGPACLWKWLGNCWSLCMEGSQPLAAL